MDQKEPKKLSKTDLDFAELQAQNRQPMHMKDWVTKLDGFLRLSERNILTNAGKVSHDLALEHAENESGKCDAQQQIINATESVSDFDKIVEGKLKELELSVKPKLPTKEGGHQRKKKK